MKEIALHILDIAQNSVSAGAGAVSLNVEEGSGTLSVSLADDGRGMTPEFLAAAADPFATTRTTRKVGLGLPFLKLAAEQTGGGLELQSREGMGTTVKAVFRTGHIDCPPMGDLAESLAILIQGAPELEVRYAHTVLGKSVSFDTREARAALGADVSLGEPEIAVWLRSYLRELEESLGSGNEESII